MKVLVTGANGFVGKHLVSALVERGHRVFACMRQGNDLFDGPVTNMIFDMYDREMLYEAIAGSEPDGIVHLAAQSSVSDAWHDPTNTLRMNAEGTIALVDIVRRLAPKAKVVTVGSGEEYGWAGKEGELLAEERGCQPQNPYAISKFAAGQLALQLAARSGLNVIHARPFNHFGPGQRQGFVVSDFASQIADIEKAVAPPFIRIGNLTASRDFTDVRDIAEAYVRLLETEVPSGIYNICSEKPVAIREILDRLLSHAQVPIAIETDPSRLRGPEVPVFAGSARKLSQATGWKPARPFETSLLETLEWWRAKR